MNIFNVRLGFAANSSSTHSLIIMENPPEQDHTNGYEFGWDYFTAATQDTKRVYCALTLADALKHQGLPDSMIDIIVERWSGVDILVDTKEKYNYDRYCGYIDHQSIYDLPQDWEGKGVSKEFFDDFIKYMLNPKLVILGGNDNGDNPEGHPLAFNSTSKTFELGVPQDTGSLMYARRDPVYNYWLLFDREKGTKIRLSMDTLQTIVPERASIPELVDIGMGTLCNQGCSFCYTGATKNGKTASCENLDAIIYALGELQVAEVALGQMEPMLFPYFERVLSGCKYFNIVPNFTTRDTNWLRNPKKWVKIIDHVGGFAYSITDAAEMIECLSLIRSNGIPFEKVSFQCVMGTMDKCSLQSILSTAHQERVSITLLGFKPLHRGAEYKKIDYSNMFNEVIVPLKNENRCPRLSIDTLLAQEWKQQLSDFNIPKVLYTTQEGKFSCYIDAVNMRIGPSSYCAEEAMLDLSTKNNYELAEKIKEQFNKL